MTMTIAPLAAVADFTSFGSNSILVQNTAIWTPAALTQLMNWATVSIESRCQARLSPFVSKVESHLAYGVSPDEYTGQGMPMDLTGALGWSQAAALGVSSMVREFNLDECAPMYGEWWNYTLESVEILRTDSGTQLFSTSDFSLWQGPDTDTGRIRMPLGTFCPIGSTIVVTYGGGYSPIPDDLNLACILQATKIALISAEPEIRKGMESTAIDDELLMLLAPYEKS